MFRCMERFRIGVGEPSALFFGLHWNARARASTAVRDWALNRTRVSAYEIGPARLYAHLERLRRRKPTHAIGYPSAFFDFCVLAQDRGESLRDLGLRAVFCTAEPLRPFQRELITSMTGARCVDTYGSAEGGLTACECPEGSLHVNVEASWLQVRGAGRGEAVVTDMMLRAFPMIRYAIGDEVTLKDGVCACGRAHPMLASIEGRSGDAIVLPNGRRINANLPSYILKPFSRLGTIRRYRFVQHDDGGIDLCLVVSRAFDPNAIPALARECASAFGADCPVRVRIVESLPILPNAKHRDFVPSARWRSRIDSAPGGS
jgi:phenylacetate-CoA ligase